MNKRESSKKRQWPSPMEMQILSVMNALLDTSQCTGSQELAQYVHRDRTTVRRHLIQLAAVGLVVRMDNRSYRMTLLSRQLLAICYQLGLVPLWQPPKKAVKANMETATL